MEIEQEKIDFRSCRQKAISHPFSTKLIAEILTVLEPFPPSLHPGTHFTIGKV